MSIKPILLIHGGVGVVGVERYHTLSSELEQEYRQGLKDSLVAGYAVLKAGGSAVEAVTAAVKSMEDNPRFSAGRGSVFTIDKTHEMNAGIMDGSTGRAGTCCAVTSVKNPIVLAKTILEKSPHTSLCGPGAEKFAVTHGLEMMKPEYFFTQHRYEQLERVLDPEVQEAPLPVPNFGNAEKNGVPVPEAVPMERRLSVQKLINGYLGGESQGPLLVDGTLDVKPCDTTGAVALDVNGRLAACTSTGGITGQLCGRVSDAAVVGAGVWADQNVAITMTGNGDYSICRSAAHTMASLVKNSKMSMEEAAKKVVFDLMTDCTSGTLVLGSDGHFCMVYNCEGMMRGFVDGDGNMTVRIWEN